MNFLKPLIISFCVICIFSCNSDESPIVDSFDFGAVPRLVELISDQFDLGNISSTAYSHEVEFLTENNGNDVSEYEILVAYDDNTISSNVDNSTQEQCYMTFGKNDFGTSQSGNANIVITIPFIELTDLLDIDPATVEAGDEFRFSSTIKLEDGRTADSDNSVNLIEEYFDWVVDIVCPVGDESLFTGLYSITYEVGGNDLIGPAYNNGDVVEIFTVASNANFREFSADLLPDLGPFAAVTRFELGCNKAVYISADTEVNCDGETTDNSIVFGPGLDVLGNPRSQFLDLTDDSEIVLFVDEGARPGNCSLNTTQSKLTLTKM